MKTENIRIQIKKIDIPKFTKLYKRKNIGNTKVFLNYAIT